MILSLLISILILDILFIYSHLSFKIINFNVDIAVFCFKQCTYMLRKALIKSLFLLCRLPQIILTKFLLP